MFEYILLGILLLLSFFFSGTETAMTAVSKPLLNELEKTGNPRAKRVNKIKQDSAGMLGTLLFGNNIVNIAITALSTSMMIELFGDKYGVLVATFGVSFVILVFSEILPKTYAMNNTLRFALLSAPILSFTVFCFAPFVKALSGLSKLIMRLLPSSKQIQITAEEVKAEIRGTLMMQTDDAVMVQETGMLKSVLELSDVTVEDIMVHRSQMVSLNVATPLPEVFDFVSRSPFSRIPLWKGSPNNIIGILHSKALLKMMNAYYRGKKTIHLMDYTTKPWSVLNTTSLLDQLHAFKKKREHFAMVVDEYGSIEGVVTLEDVLEEIVGDISDENDRIEESTLQVVKTEAGGWQVDGAATIRDINRHFNWELPDTNAATIAGYIMYAIERIPNVGETFVIDGYSFTVVQKERHRIATIEILPPAA